MQSRSDRLDRLPFTRRHARLLLGSGLGWALDAMDVGLIGFVMAALAKQWSLSAVTLGWIGSIGFAGMAVGASLGGLLADRIGRRQVFALTLLVYGLATGAAALSVSVAMLVALRFVVGIGLGAELPVASTLVSEYAPRRIRGRVVVALEAFWALGWIFAALLGFFLIPASPAGWRWALAVGMVPAAYALYVRFRLPESVRFLERHGRVEEAEAAVQLYERAAGVQPTRSELVEIAAPRAESIWSPALRRRTAALWAVWFGINLSYYGAFTWIPTLLSAGDAGLTRSFAWTLVITLAQVPGYAAAAVLIEVWGRRATLATFLAGSAAAAMLFGWAVSQQPLVAGWVIGSGCLLSFFNLGAWGALYAVGPEVYPTASRGTGTGAAAAFGRVAAMVAPLCVPPLLTAGGRPLVFGTFAVAFAVATVGALFLPERRGQTLAA
ncbi:MAG: MFS transporter [Actinobacteria bacterium]|nr:MFS transporter [Actinomycetota bacterium]